MNSSVTLPMQTYSRAAYLVFHGLDVTLLAFVMASILAFPIPNQDLFWAALYTSPLPLKENLSLAFIFPIIALYVARSLLMGRFEYLRTPYNPLLLAGLVAVIAYAALSPAGRLAWRDSVLVLSHLAFFFIICSRTKDRRFRRLLYIVLGVATALAALAALLQVNSIYLGFLIKSTGERTFMASTIGHNISVAIFLMVMTFHLVGVAIAYRRPGEESSRARLMRKLPAGAEAWILYALIGAVALLNTYLIVVSMTRAVWLTYPFCLLVFMFLFLGLRRRLRQSRRAMLVWGGVATLLLVVTIGIGVSLNKEAVNARLRTFQYDILIQNTRARLNAVGLEMIRDKPVLGHGLAGFKYQYPFYQRAFFEQHPETRLVPTQFHTDRAHNEFLQVWIEFGILGLLIVLYFLGLHGYYAWTVLFRWRNDKKTILFLAAFVATLGILIANTISFEFHVQSSAMIFLLSIALMCGLDGKTRVQEVSLQQLAARGALRTSLAAGCLVIAVLAGTVPARWSMGESWFYLGEETKNRATVRMEAGDRAGWQRYVGASAIGFEKAADLAPYYGLYAFNLGQVQMLMAANRVPHPSTGEIVTYDDALASFHEATETWQFKDLHYYIAQALLTQLSSNQAPSDSDARGEMQEQILHHMRMAAGINPHDRDMRYRLALTALLINRPDEAVPVLEKMKDEAPEEIQNRLKSDFQRYVREGRRSLARQIIQVGYIVFPDNWEFAYSRALAYLEYESNPQAALDTVMGYWEHHQEDSRSVRGISQLYERMGRPEKAISTLVNSIEGADINTEVALWLVYVDELYRRLGRGNELAEFWDEQLRTRKILGPNARSIVLMRTGRIALAAGDLDRARRELQQAYDLNRGMERGLAYREAVDSLVLLPFLMTQ